MPGLGGGLGVRVVAGRRRPPKTLLEGGALVLTQGHSGGTPPLPHPFPTWAKFLARGMGPQKAEYSGGLGQKARGAFALQGAPGSWETRLG